MRLCGIYEHFRVGASSNQQLGQIRTDLGRFGQQAFYLNFHDIDENQRFAAIRHSQQQIFTRRNRDQQNFAFSPIYAKIAPNSGFFALRGGYTHFSPR